MDIELRCGLLLLSIATTLALAGGCRDVAEVEGLETDIDEDAGSDTDTDTDADADTDSEPTGMVPGVPYQLDGATRELSAARSDSHLAVSYTQTAYSAVDYRFAVLPWDQPDEAVTGSLPSPCGYDVFGSNRTFPHGDDFMVFLRPASPMELCFASGVLMDVDAEPVGEAYDYDDLFYDDSAWWHWHTPDGYLGEDGELIAADVWSVDETDGPYDDDVVFMLTRFGPGSAQDVLAQEVYDWSAFGPNDGVGLGHCRRKNFTHGTEIAAVAYDGDWNGETSLVLAKATLDGEVTLPPTQVLELPGNPVDSTHHNPAFAQHGDEIAGVDLHWNVEGDESFTAGHSFVVDFDGEVLAGPTEIPALAFDKEFVSLVQVTGLAWSGESFGYCYRVWNGPYEFLILDESGDQLLEPIAPLGEAPLKNQNTYCDVVALAGDLFAVFMSVEEGNADYEPGLYLVYVQVDHGE